MTSSQASESQALGNSRIRVRHLLVGTTCVAGHLALTRAMSSHSQRQFPPDASLSILWVLNSIASGFALGGLLLLTSRRNQGIRYPNHPGEWLWVLLGISTTVMLVMGGLQLWPAARAWLRLGEIVATLFLHSLYVLAALRVHELRWRVFFLAHVLNLLLNCGAVVVGAAGSLSFFGVVAENLILLCASSMDARKNTSYPWTHWLGVGIHILYWIFTTVAWFIL